MHFPAQITVARALLTRRSRLTLMLVGSVGVSGVISMQVVAAQEVHSASAPVVMRYFQVQSALTFYNASNQVIKGYPPVGGHVRDDDLDYVGSNAHHASTATASDHLFCTVISAPANAKCYLAIAIGGSLLYTDNLAGNLASSSDTFPIYGGTGAYAGMTGTTTGTPIGKTNNANLVITLH